MSASSGAGPGVGSGIGAAARPGPPPAREGLPTLTEVLEGDAGSTRVVPAAESGAPAERASSPLPDAEQLGAQVLAAVQQQVDLMFEFRLREALAPALARAADSLIRDIREELCTTLRDVVQRAVAQELAKRRPR